MGLLFMVNRVFDLRWGSYGLGVWGGRLTRIVVIGLVGWCSFWIPAAVTEAGCLDTPDHLEPSASILASFNRSFEYQTAVREALLAEQTDKPYFRVIGLPAFFSEWSITIDAPSEGYARVQFLETRKPVSKRRGYRRPAVEKSTSNIEEVTAKTLRSILETMLLETRSCATLDGYTGFDGETYIFSGFILKRGVLSGETWTPQEGTRAAQLVAATTLLIRLTRAMPEDQSELRQQLHEVVTNLKNSVLAEDG